MSKVLASELKENDFIDINIKGIPGFQAPVTLLKGMIRRISIYPNRSVSGEGQVDLSYVELLTDQGIKGVYLRMTDELIKQSVSDAEREAAILSSKLRTLTRVVSQQGSDPEIFIVDKNNQVIPSFLFLRGKDKPNRIPENSQPIFWDGFQAEFNLDARSCLDGTLTSVWYGLNELNKLAKKYNSEARLTIQPTIDIPPHMLLENKDEHVQFGCMPSKNAYGMKGIVADGKDVPFRSAGGHIHLELSNPQKAKIEQYVKALDAILGVACVAMFAKYDDPRRRQYYGLAGEYRTPSHGLEYRPLSNVWMCHPTATYIIFELARKVISLVDAGLFKHWKYDEKEVIKCINDANVMVACSILDENEKMFKDILASFCYNNQNKVTVVYNTFMNGIENLINNPDDVETNWNLGKNCITGAGRISNLESNPNYQKLLEMK